MKKFSVYFFLYLLFNSSSFCAQQNDSLSSPKLFELSFGHSVLFLSPNQQSNIRNNEAIVVPTSGILFLAELRPSKIIRFPVFFSLPTESKQFIVNGELINERASPTLGTGLEIKCFGIKLDKKSKIEFEAGPLLSVLLDSKKSLRFAPVIAGRIKIMRGENFVMYLGTSYSVGIDAWGLLYGTGTTF